MISLVRLPSPALRWPRAAGGSRLPPGCWPLLLAALLLPGCSGSESGPELAVREFRTWPMPPDGTRIPAPRAVHAGPGNELYVLDNAGRVLVFSMDGRLARQWRMPESSVGKPEKICVLRDGRIVVADTHYHRLVFFDRLGKVLSKQGGYGREPGQFIYPVAIVQDDRENYYVCEYGDNDRVQKFSRDGKFLLQFGGVGTHDGEFQRPSGIVWREGRIYVVDAFNNRIQVFADSGKFLHVLGGEGPASGLHYPYDVTQSTDGDLYVVEYGAGRVSRFDRQGRLTGRYGTTGSEVGELATPWGVTMSGNSRLWIADTGNRRIVELQL